MLFSGWEAFVLLGFLVFFGSPFIIVSLIAALLTTRRIQRRRIAALIGGMSALVTLWAVPFGLISLIAIFDYPDTADGDPPWWLWLGQWLALLSGPVFVSAALIGWFSATPATGSYVKDQAFAQPN